MKSHFCVLLCSVLLLAAAPHVESPSLLLVGGTPSTASGIVDWSLCGDGTANYPCAARETTTKPAGGTITVSAPASTCYSGSTLIATSANDLCSTASGAEIWSAANHSNTLLQSQTIATGTAATSPWSAAGNTAAAPSLDDDAAAAPDGTATADRATFSAIGGSNQFSLLYQQITASTHPYTASVWIRTVTGTATLYLAISDGLTKTTNTACSVTTTWTRCSATTPSAGGANWYVLFGPDARYGQPTTQAGADVYLWGASAQASPVAGPYVATTSAPVSGSAGAVSVATTLTNPAKWCVGVRATPAASTWNTMGDLWTLSSGNAGTANSAIAVTLNATSATLDVYDASVAVKRWGWDPRNVSSGERRLVWCNSGATASMYVDGVPMALTPTGVGTGTLAAVPSTAFPFSRNGANNNSNGAIKKFCQGSTFSAVNRCLGVP